MDIAMGAMNTLLPKLTDLVAGEYMLQKGVKREIKELNKELASMNLALHMVAEVPLDQLDKQVKIWADDVRELSYDIEDQVDTFMLRSKQEHKLSQESQNLIGKVTNLIKKIKTNHQIHNAIKEIMDEVKKVAERRDRYKIDNIVISKKADNTTAKPDIVPVDPRLEAMYKKATELVGIGRPKNELAKRLLEQDHSSPSWHQSNIISIVGFGGLGKTTLANSLFQDLKSKFSCHIFVSVSLNPDIMMVFKNILLQLNDTKCVRKDEPWEMRQLINRTIELLKNRRCLCVIDDLWKESAWDTIKLAFQGGHPESKIIITTRNKNVAEYVCGGVYELKPLSDGDSRKLFNKRIFDNDDGCPPSLRDVTTKILKKCGGVPLAIITTASLVASKPRCLDEWEKVNEFFSHGLDGDSLHVDKMMKILSLSYNDLPFHLKTCLLSLSKYPEDHLIRKDVLVWNWIAEGFIKQGTLRPGGQSLQEKAESYFNDLINRSLIQPVQSPMFSERDGEVHWCRVHDIVLEFINQLSAEEGFVTKLLSEDGQQTSTLTSAMQKRKIRRLSLKSNSIKVEFYGASPKAIGEQLSKVRSLDVFGKVKLIPLLSSFHLLRVLQVDDCSRLDSNHLNDLGKLHLLRILRLHGLKVTELPESICELELLETLDIRPSDTRYVSTILLPVSLTKLGKLVRLLGFSMELLDGLSLENMTSLRELRGILATLHALTEIGKLKELKVLELHIPDHNSYQVHLPSNTNRLIIKCLQSFPCLQIFILWALELHVLPVDLMAWLPSSLRTFINFGGFFKEAFPKWTKPQLSHLTVLHLILSEVRVLPEHLEQLAELPSLRFLKLQLLDQPDEQEKLSSASGFPCLIHLDLTIPLLFLTFQQGTMPKLQKLLLEFAPRSTIEHFQTNTFDCGLDNLPSLRHVAVHLMQRCPEVKDTIRNAVSDHPNHPSLDLA